MHSPLVVAVADPVARPAPAHVTIGEGPGVPGHEAPSWIDAHSALGTAAGRVLQSGHAHPAHRPRVRRSLAPTPSCLPGDVRGHADARPRRQRGHAGRRQRHHPAAAAVRCRRSRRAPAHAASGHERRGQSQSAAADGSGAAARACDHAAAARGVSAGRTGHRQQRWPGGGSGRARDARPADHARRERDARSHVPSRGRRAGARRRADHAGLLAGGTRGSRRHRHRARRRRRATHDRRRCRAGVPATVPQRQLRHAAGGQLGPCTAKPVAFGRDLRRTRGWHLAVTGRRRGCGDHRATRFGAAGDAHGLERRRPTGPDVAIRASPNPGARALRGQRARAAHRRRQHRQSRDGARQRPCRRAGVADRARRVAGPICCACR